MSIVPAVTDPAIEAAAQAVLQASADGQPLPPFSQRQPGFDLATGYRIGAAVRRLRQARGETPVGRKIGFTNRAIWAEYGVWAPIWGEVYDRTLHDWPAADRERDGAAAPTFVLGTLAEPRIEPEIVLGLARAPEPGMDEAALLGCIGWVAHGFEIVQSLYPGWRFAAADTVAAFGMHGALLVGPRQPVAVAGAAGAALAAFTITLSRNGEVVDQGCGSNVLDGPLQALRHLVNGLAADPVHEPLRAGELVTTGTLTRAFPVAPGERWQTRLAGIGLEPMAVHFA